MSKPSVLGSALYQNESTWAASSSTFSSRFPLINEVDISGLQQASLTNTATVQYAGDRATPIRGCYGGSFRTRAHLPGHGSSTASGTPTAEEHETVLGYAIGTQTTSGAATTATGGTVTAITTAAASGLTAGGIVFCGSLGDGRGEGQAAVISTHSGSSLAVLTAIPAAMTTSDVIASSVIVHPNEAAASQAITSTRWHLMSANYQVRAFGCFPMSVTIGGLNPSETPWYEIEWGVSWFTFVAGTFPTTTAVDTFAPAPMAAGSLFANTRGTSTRVTYAYRSAAITIDLGVQPLYGPGGVDANQCIVGAVRGQHTASLEFVVDAGAASTAPDWPTRWDTNSDWHALLTFNGAATGKRMAFYMPSAWIDDSKPMQFNDGGINRERVRLVSRTGQTTTSELTLSSYRIAFG